MTPQEEDLISRMYWAAQYAKVLDSMFLEIIARGLMVDLCHDLKPEAVPAAASGEMLLDYNVATKSLFLGCGEATLEDHSSVLYSFETGRWITAPKSGPVVGD